MWSPHAARSVASVVRSPGWLMTALLAACAGPMDPASRSVVLFNGHIIPMDAGTGVSEGVAIADERIVRLGSSSEVLELAAPGTEVIDLKGQVVLPGVVDAHTHLFNDAEQYLGLDLAGAQALALENGITTLGNLFVTPEFLAEMQAFETSGRLKVRTSLYLRHTDNCGVVRERDWWTAHPPTRQFGERLRIGGIKVFTDGGSCGRPAVSAEFRPGSGFGVLYLTADEIAEVVAAAEQTGHQVVIHAIGDRAVQAAQDGIALALQGRPNRLRHRIDHNALVSASLIPRYAEIGIHPVVFGHFPLLREMLPDPGACIPTERNEFYEAFLGNTRLLLDELPGLHVAWHGDDPWIGPVSPFRELYNMVTRVRRRADGSICTPADWQLKTRITVEEGLRMMTSNSAFALFRETEVGSLEPGKLADLIVVTKNPFEVAPDDLWDIEVSLTMIGGEVVFCRAGVAVHCPGKD